jgi:hypothetical protein
VCWASRSKVLQEGSNLNMHRCLVRAQSSERPCMRKSCFDDEHKVRLQCWFACVHADSYQNSCRASMQYAEPRVWQRPSGGAQPEHAQRFVERATHSNINEHRVPLQFWFAYMHMNLHAVSCYRSCRTRMHCAEPHVWQCPAGGVRPAYAEVCPVRRSKDGAEDVAITYVRAKMPCRSYNSCRQS